MSFETHCSNCGAVDSNMTRCRCDGCGELIPEKEYRGAAVQVTVTHDKHENPRVYCKECIEKAVTLLPTWNCQLYTRVSDGLRPDFREEGSGARVNQEVEEEDLVSRIAACKTTAEVDAVLRAVEEERDYWRSRALALEADRQAFLLEHGIDLGKRPTI